MEEIFEFLNQIYPLSPGCIDYLRNAVQPRLVSKQEIILDFGEVDQHLYFIKSGTLHCYYMIENKPVSDWFFWENETVVSIGSFYDQVPSEDRIIALEDGELYYITKAQYDYLNLNFLEFNFIARVLLEKYLKVFHDHVRLIRKHRNPESYKLLLAKYPEMVQRLPLAALATWLNMEPETLSRVRSSLD